MSAAPEATRAAWSITSRIAFRFAFSYFVLFCFPFPVGQIPFTEPVAELYSELWKVIVPWVARSVFHLEITNFTNGSGDTAYDYLEVLCYLVLAVLATLVWSVLDRRRLEYEKLYAGLRVYLRYALGVIIIGYGMAKVIKTQFPFPGPERLITPYGESSPMGLLWTFMGYSTAYNVFTGGAELLGGLLLFFRRTTTLGALVTAAVMSNVVMLNFCYDVPVKLFSSHLLLMAVFVTLPDLGRLANLFLLNRPTEPVPARIPFKARWMERGRIAVKVLFIGHLLVMGVRSHLNVYTQYGDAAPGPPLSGLYEVETFVRDGQEIPPLFTDASRWRRVTINRFGVLTIKTMVDSSKRLRTADDPDKKTITLTSFEGKTDPIVLDYTRPDPDHLELSGPYDKATVKVRLRKVAPSTFLLVNRGFHWINEFPLNR